MEGILGKCLEVVGHDGAHPRRVFHHLHLAHALAEKVPRVSGETLDEVVENA